jgi:hypothetical protein
LRFANTGKYLRRKFSDVDEIRCETLRYDELFNALTTVFADVVSVSSFTALAATAATASAAAAVKSSDGRAKASLGTSVLRRVASFLSTQQQQQQQPHLASTDVGSRKARARATLDDTRTD